MSLYEMDEMLLDKDFFAAFEASLADAIITQGFKGMRGVIHGFAATAHGRGVKMGRHQAFEIQRKSH